MFLLKDSYKRSAVTIAGGLPFRGDVSSLLAFSDLKTFLSGKALPGLWSRVRLPPARPGHGPFRLGLLSSPLVPPLGCPRSAVGCVLRLRTHGGGLYRTSTASARSQRHCRTSTASARSRSAVALRPVAMRYLRATRQSSTPDGIRRQAEKASSPPPPTPHHETQGLKARRMSEQFVEIHFVVERNHLEVWKAFCRTGLLSSSRGMHPIL